MAKDTRYAQELWGRLKKLIDHAGGVRARFARTTGVGEDRIQWWATHPTVPESDALAKIIHATGCSARWLMTGADDMFGCATEASRTIAVVSCAHTGNRADAACQLAEPETLFGTETNRLPQDLFEIEVCGDSMQPIAMPGQHLLCVHDTPASGDLAVIILAENNWILFKRVYISEDGKTVQGISVNPSPEYAPVTFKRSAIRDMYKVWGVKFG